MRQVSRFAEHHLEWVRGRIFTAYSVELRSKSLFDVTNYEMSESASCVPVDDYDEKNSKTLKKYESDVRSVRGDIFVVKAREVRVSKGSVPLAPSAFEDARVVRAVRSLEIGQQHWLRYAYSDAYKWDDEQGATVALWEAFKSQLSGARAETVNKCKALAYLCLQDFKHFRLRGEYKYPPSEVQRLARVPDSNWRRDWLPRWRAMQEILAELDRQALALVLERIYDRNHTK